jgi:hypothetical protein
MPRKAPLLTAGADETMHLVGTEDGDRPAFLAGCRAYWAGMKLTENPFEEPTKEHADFDRLASRSCLVGRRRDPSLILARVRAIARGHRKNFVTHLWPGHLPPSPPEFEGPTDFQPSRVKFPVGAAFPDRG